MNTKSIIKKEIYVLTNNIPYKGFTKPAPFKTNIITIERLKPGEEKQERVPLNWIDLKKWRESMSKQEYDLLSDHSKQVLQMN